MRRPIALFAAALLIAACAASQPAPSPAAPRTAAPRTGDPTWSPVPSSASPAPGVSSAPAAPVTSHPRLWLTPADVTRLRSWAVPDNPAYANGLAPLLERARADMDANQVPGQDCGQRAYSEYVTEAYAELFAFAALVEPDAAARTGYASRARTLLMHVLDAAAQGPASAQDARCPGDPDTPVFPPFRDPAFFTEDSDRLRWQGEAFPLVVDWIYPSLTAQDKATIKTVFTRWGQEIIERGYHHPQPVGVLRDPQLTANTEQVRWAGNNYFAAHMRNLGMLAMALDEADAGPQLRGYLNNATGAWLYLFDANTRTASQGGLLPEGLEYSPQTASYAIQFLLALKTAGQADPALHGPEVVVETNPFWNDLVVAYLHAASPATVDAPDVGPMFEPAFYGDGQRYHLPDFIDAFGALAQYDRLTGNTARLEQLRWIQLNTPPGGAAKAVDRLRRADYFRSSLFYFMLLDPAAAPPADPRPALSTGWYAAGMQRLYSRSGWGTDASWFNYALSWNQIDHQQADGNHFELYRKGEWLTKARLGYANIAEGIASSEFRNTLAVQNVRPANQPDDDWRVDLWRRGSQWNYVASADPPPPLHSFGATFTYAAGDATNLYNSASEGSTEVQHASRALVWLQPDFVVVYDRAAAPAGRFKRVWWQLPGPATVSGSQARAVTKRGQQLLITALLPAGAALSAVDRATDNVGETVARDEPMTDRLVVQAPDGSSARFLHVLQGADAGASAAAATLIRSGPGDQFVGAVVRGTAVLFPAEAGQPFSNLSYTAPVGTFTQIITGLTPGTSYQATVKTDASGITVTVIPGAGYTADSGGVLLLERVGARRMFIPATRS